MSLSTEGSFALCCFLKNSEDWLRNTVPPRRASLNDSSQFQVEEFLRLPRSLIMRLTPQGSSSQEDPTLIEARCPQLAHADRLNLLSASRQATGTLALMASQSFANREVMGQVHSSPRERSLGVAGHRICKSTFRARCKRNPASTVLLMSAAKRRLRIKSRLMDLRMLQRIAERMRRIRPWIIAPRGEPFCS